MSSRTLLATAALAALVPLAAFADSGANAIARTSVSGNGPGGSTLSTWNFQVPNGAYGYGQSPTSVFSASGGPGTATATSQDHGVDGNGTHTASSIASSSLLTGSVSASETNAGYAPGGRDDAGQPTSEIYDVLTFHAAGADASTVSTFDVTFTVHSDLDLTSNPGNGARGSDIYATLYVGREARNDFLVGADGSLQVVNDNYPTTWDGGQWTVTGSGADRTFTFTGTLSFTGATWSTKLDEELQVYCYDGAQCSSTASIAFGVPTGVTMTSESGLFLTAGSPSAVPEPQNALLMLGGLGALVIAARRRLASSRA